MKWRALRVSILSAATAGLIAAHIGDVLPAYGGEPSPAVVKDRNLRAPSDDIRSPEHRPITSPGFPSGLSGRCLTWQDCQKYCESHQSDPACDRLIADPGGGKSPGAVSSSERYLHFREQVEKLKKNPDDVELREWIIENTKIFSPSSLHSEEAFKLKNRADAMFAKAQTAADIMEAATVYKKALELAPWDRTIYHDLGMALQKSGDMAHAAYTATAGMRDICEPDMRQAAETIMARYREASINLRFSLSKTGDQALTEKKTLMQIDNNMLTIYRLKGEQDRECCLGCRGIKPEGSKQ